MYYKFKCENCGKVSCENFQRQRKDCCENWVSYKDYIKELEAQIDKMKCCANCKHSRTEYEHCITNKHEKWEIKENDNTRIIRRNAKAESKVRPILWHLE